MRGLLSSATTVKQKYQPTFQFVTTAITGAGAGSSVLKDSIEVQALAFNRLLRSARKLVLQFTIEDKRYLHKKDTAKNSLTRTSEFFHFSLFIFHFSFFIFHFLHSSLFIFHFLNSSLFIFHFSLFTFHSSFFTFHFLNSSFFTFHFSFS